MHNDDNDLIAKIKILEAENAALSVKAEDTLLFGLAAEIIYQTEDSSQLIDQILERISILKNIPFCACLTQTETGLHIEGFYSSFAELQQSDIQISLPDFRNIIPEEGFLILNQDKFKSAGFSFRFINQSFQPDCLLIIPGYSKNIRNRFFVFLDEVFTDNKFTKLVMLLQQIVQLAAERLENIYIFGELTQINLELDQRVKERTKELSKTNEILNKEINIRKIVEGSLRLNEQKLLSVYNAAIDVAFITVNLSKDYIIQSFSPGAEKMFGISAEEVFGKPLGLFQESDQLVLFPSIKNELDEIGWSRKEEISLRRKNGEHFTAMLTVYPLYNEESRVDGALAVCIDISELKQTQNELMVARENAEESDRLKTAFLQNMSHEIRTPMNAILGFADLLPEFFEDQEKLIRFTDIIKQRGTDLLEIINDVLDIARIESGQLVLNPDDCKLSDLFDEIESYFNDYQTRINNTNVEFKLKISGNLRDSEVIVDQVKLKQILNNLVENAFKFTKFGKIELGCTIEKQNQLSFYVMDTGIGIPKEKHAEIFSHFTQHSQNSDRLYGGTGLGLSIVAGLLDLMGGKIWLESEKGVGSTFYFTVPFNQSNQQVQLLKEEQEAEKPYNPHNFTILVVEDDEFNAMYIKEILADTDYNCLHTKFGKQAIEICSKQTIDLVIIDIRLPDITGYQAIMLLRKQNPDIRIIAQTAYFTPDDEKKALNSGCNDYFLKPIGSEFLISRIDHHLKLQKNQVHI